MLNVQLKIKKIDNEYCILWIQNGVIDENKTYYTDDKQDAIDTKKAIIKAYSNTNYTRLHICSFRSRRKDC